MKWEDTVKQQIYPQTHEEHLASLQNQAKISFKAGAVNEREKVGTDLQVLWAKLVKEDGYDQFRLVRFFSGAIGKLCKGQALKEKK